MELHHDSSDWQEEKVFRVCPEYIDIIARYLRTIEHHHRPSTSFLTDRQTDVNPQMRSILVDWLNEVTEEFSLKPETLCLAVNYCDRYLTKVQVRRNRLQLVGVTCMLIASKYEEIRPPTVDDFVYITDDTYTRDDILKTEIAVLNALEFNMTAVTVRDFTLIYLKGAQADELVCMLTDYLVELSLQDYAFLRYLPSMISASAVVLALYTLREPYWSEVMARQTMYHPAHLNDCVQELYATFRNSASSDTTLQAVKEKYSHSKYLWVSARVPPSPIAPTLR